jgi:LAO/AO transport system kinase
MDIKFEKLLNSLHQGDHRSLARCISIVENQSSESGEILRSLNFKTTIPIIGITGPPGAGKSTLVNELVNVLLENEKVRIGILAVDPTSPFTKGSLLGDRIRMSGQFTNPSVYIRSLASRGALGGLSARAFEVIDLMKASGFDYIIVETVGVGQSEIEIAELADVTVVVFVPGAGDEVQAIKSGIVEIADIFVVNKSDREGADKLVKTLSTMAHSKQSNEKIVPVIKTTATTGKGVSELVSQIKSLFSKAHDHRSELLYQRSLRLAGDYLLKKYNLNELKKDLKKASEKEYFNIHSFLASYFRKNNID